MASPGRRGHELERRPLQRPGHEEARPRRPDMRGACLTHGIYATGMLSDPGPTGSTEPREFRRARASCRPGGGRRPEEWLVGPPDYWVQRDDYPRAFGMNRCALRQPLRQGSERLSTAVVGRDSAKASGGRWSCGTRAGRGCVCRGCVLPGGRARMRRCPRDRFPPRPWPHKRKAAALSDRRRASLSGSDGQFQRRRLRVEIRPGSSALTAPRRSDDENW